MLSFCHYSLNQNNQVQSLDMACVSKSFQEAHSYLDTKNTTASSWESSDKFYEPKSLAHNFMMKRVLHGFAGIPCTTDVKYAALTPQPSTCTTSALLPVSVSSKAIAAVVFQTQTSSGCNAHNFIFLSKNGMIPRSHASRLKSALIDPFPTPFLP